MSNPSQTPKKEVMVNNWWLEDPENVKEVERARTCNHCEKDTSKTPCRLVPSPDELDEKVVVCEQCFIKSCQNCGTKDAEHIYADYDCSFHPYIPVVRLCAYCYHEREGDYEKTNIKEDCYHGREGDYEKTNIKEKETNIKED